MACPIGYVTSVTLQQLQPAQPTNPRALLGSVLGVVMGALRRRPRHVITVVVLTVTVGALGAFSLLLLVPVLEGLGSDGVSRMDLPIVGVVTAPLYALLGLVVLLVVARSLLERKSAMVGAELRLQLIDELRTDAMATLIEARWSFFLGRRISDLIHTLQADIGRAAMAVDTSAQAFASLITLVFTLAVALSLSPPLTLVATIITVFVMLLAWPTIKASYGLGREMSGRGRTSMASNIDALSSLRLVRAHDAGRYWLKAVTSGYTDLREVQLEQTRRTSTNRAVQAIGAAVGASIVVLVGFRIGVPPAQLLVLVFIYSRIVTAVTGMTRQTQMLVNAAPALHEVEALISAASQAREVPRAAEGEAAGENTAEATSSAPTRGTDSGATSPSGRDAIDLRSDCPEVVLQNVSFRYPASQIDALHVERVDIPAGKVTAITGPSGAGKSTLVDTVLGLLEPATGAVLVDGQPLEPAAMSSWRSRLGYVPQDQALLPGTLRTNLTWSLPDPESVTDEHLREALRTVSADFIDELPDGLDTVLGERGVRLSGGERQRVSLARAMLREPSFLVLDEATSSLDGITEAEIQRWISGLRDKVTVLVVAHRATSVSVADHVVLLSEGRVLAQGKAEELLAEGSAVQQLLAGIN